MKITPVLLVQSIEECLPFWMDRLGFENVAQVPDGDALGFVILVRGEATVMLQTFESVRKDEPKFVGSPDSHHASLFVQVDDWEDTLARLAGYELAMPQRDTFYGMREIGVFAPGGHAVIFAKATG